VYLYGASSIYAHRICISSSARQIEVYLGAHDTYYTTVKSTPNISSTSFDAKLSISDAERVFKIKFLSLSDRTKTVFRLDKLSITLKSPKKMPSQSAILQETRVHGGIPTTPEAIVNVISNLVDSKLSPILARLEALETAVTRNEAVLGGIVKSLRKGSFPSTKESLDSDTACKSEDVAAE